MKIRPYRPADAHPLANIHRAVFPANSHTTVTFDQYMKRLVASGGYAWVLYQAQQTAGYAAVAPVTGLDGIYTIEGFIAPELRRQGLGTQLLIYLLRDLEGASIKQLSYSVRSLEEPAAKFLRHHRFLVEHEEWLMIRPSSATLPASPKVALRRYPRRRAIHHFCALYEQSFAGLPWYQPYTPAEVDATLQSSADLLFLVIEELPAGFVWVREPEPGLGEIEPIGVVAAHQSQGFGRALLLAGLHQLAERGLDSVRIGAWRENQRAIRLYRNLGFQHHQTLTYLAFDLPE